MGLFTDKPGSRVSRLNPFTTYSNFIYPKTISEVLIWAEWMYSRFPNYRTSITKLVSYFVSGFTVTQSDIDTNEVDNDSVQQFTDLLTDTYNMQSDILQFGIELATMGNAFVSADPIISRMLLCPCGFQASLKQMHSGLEYKWDGKDFKGVCPQCGKTVKYQVKDIPATGEHGEKVRFVYRSAKDMRLQYNHLTGTCKFYYKLPAYIKAAIQRGDSVYLEDTPMVFLRAAATDELVEFPSDRFFAMRTHTLTSLDRLYKGWGVPLFMSSFGDYINIQHLNKFNEAVTMDYIAPIRMLSPQPANLQAGADPNRMVLPGGQFRNFMQDAVRRVRENPTTWLISPVPAQYQMLGGEAKGLAPVELLEWQNTQALANQGIPQEFKQTTFQVVAPSMGLRMFERQHIQFNKDLNEYTRWKARVIADVHHVQNMTCTLDTTSFVEDDMNKQVLTGLMQGGLISKTNVLKRYGVDFETDIKTRVKEQQQEEEIAIQQQTDMQGREMVGSVMPPAGGTGVQAAQGNIERIMQQAQAAAQGGMPAPPAGPAGPEGPMAPAGGAMPFGTGNSPSPGIEQLNQQAEQIAQQLYTADPLTRRRQLTQLKSTNPPLHALVKQIIENQKQMVSADAVAQSQAPQG